MEPAGIFLIALFGLLIVAGVVNNRKKPKDGEKKDEDNKD